MFTLEQINSFCAVYQHSSYSKAARKLAKDRSTIREHVMVMEDHIGSRLFEIQGRSAVPTELAQKLYPRARILAQQIFEFNQNAMGAFDTGITVVNIAHDSLMPPAMAAFIEARFSDKYPFIALNWLRRSRDEALQGLVDGEVQLLIGSAQARVIPDQHVLFRNLGTVKVSAFVGHASPLRDMTNISLKQLELEKQYVAESHLDVLYQRLQISPKRHIVSEHMLVHMLMEQGWALLSEEFAKPFVDKGMLFPLQAVEIMHAQRNPLAAYFSAANEHQPVISDAVVWLEEYAREFCG